MANSYVQSLLSENEKILRVSRQHWFTLVSAIILEIILILLIIALTTAIGIALPQFALFISLAGLVILLVVAAFMLRDILDWSNRQFIVTNRRVMQIAGLINKNVIDSSLEKVNDVKMQQSYLGRIFNYGDVEILTASELGVNLFRRIQDPIKFKTTMLDAKEHLERGDYAASQPKDDIPSMIASLEQLRQQGALTEEEFQRKKAELLARI